jgi:hypothetical protein
MSKVDAQRAMREAKYARVRASGPTRREAAAREQPPTAPTSGPPSTPAPAVAEAAPTLAAPSAEGCGHKSMNGRTCTRPAGHAEKSHRYS